MRVTNNSLTIDNRLIKAWNILKGIFGREIFSSPTEMCVNMIHEGFVDDSAIRLAAEREIKRRYDFFKNNPEMNIRGITDFERCIELIKKYSLNVE